jgi:hypothetical protein
MMSYADEYDRKQIDRARRMAALRTTDELRAYYAAEYPEGNPAHDLIQNEPLAAFFGGAAAAFQDLLWIIERQAATIAHLTGAQADDDSLADVPMVCTVCRQPVEQISGPGGEGALWAHDITRMADPCRGNRPIKAMVAAGNEEIPLDLAKPALSVRLGDV